MYRRFKKNNSIIYYSSDFENEFLADRSYDITNIPIENNFFNIIICYHILEHIEDDQKAISELYRVLKTDGTLYIQTPFKEGDTYENPQIKTPEERLIHFGQEDHVRIYSADDLAKRLNKENFQDINILNFENTQEQWFNLLKNEKIVVCIK